MKKEKENSIHEMIAKSLAGETTEQENGIINVWRNRSAENADLYSKLEKVWKLTGEFAPQSLDIDVDAEWIQFQEHVDSRRRKQSTPAKESVRWFERPVFRLAASVLILLTVALILYQVQRGSQTTYLADHSGMVVDLMDGSQVHLYKGSELVVQKEYGSANRLVKLVGEGFFEVAGNPDSPFIVSAEGVQVEVLGTSFSVVANADRPNVSVIVATGIVSMTYDQDPARSVILNPGEKGVFDAITGSVAKQVNTDVNYLAWKTHKIEFDNTNLIEVIEVLEKVYEIRVSLESDHLKACPVTVTFDRQSLESVLEVLGATLDIEFKISETYVKISGSGC